MIQIWGGHAVAQGCGKQVNLTDLFIWSKGQFDLMYFHCKNQFINTSQEFIKTRLCLANLHAFKMAALSLRSPAVQN